MTNSRFNWVRNGAVAAACGLFLAAPSSRIAKADTFDEQTTVAFTSPVAIPGQVLPAGTYVFKMSPDPLQRDIVWIFDATKSHLIATEQTLPAIWRNPPDQPVIQLDESASGAPARLHEFVFPGIGYGHEFVYDR